jgi:hypothetical protein
MKSALRTLHALFKLHTKTNNHSPQLSNSFMADSGEREWDLSVQNERYDNFTGHMWCDDKRVFIWNKAQHTNVH